MGPPCDPLPRRGASFPPVGEREPASAHHRPRGAAPVFRLLRALLASCALLLGAGPCRPAAEVAGRTGLLPWPFAEAEVLRLAPRGPYLEAELAAGGAPLRLLLPDTPACRSVARAGARVSVSRAGVFGRLHAGEEHCDPVGVLSLARFRDRIARPRPAAPVVAGTARFEAFHRDDDFVFVRGRFPYLSALGLPSYDLVVLLPTTPACLALAEAGEATLVYSPSGRRAYWLMAEGGDCELAGFAIPPTADSGGGEP